MFGNGKEQLEQRIEELEGFIGQWQEAVHSRDGIIDQQKDTIDRLESTTDSNRQTIDFQWQEIKRLKTADDIAAFAVVALRKAEQSDEAVISPEDEAREVVVERLKAQTRAEQVNQLMAQAEREVRKDFGAEEITALRTEIDHIFSNDGTYTRLREKVELDERDKVSKALVDEEQLRLEAEFAVPEKHNELVAEQQDALVASGELDRIRKAATDEQIALCHQEAVDRAKAAIRADLDAHKEQLVQDYLATWRDSDEGQAYYRQAKAEQLELWAAKGREAIARELQDEATLEALHELNQRTKDEIAGDIPLDDFGLTGFEANTLAKNTKFTLYMGEIANTGGTTIDGKYYSRERHGVRCRRVLQLTALGDGSFVVNDDTSSMEPVGSVITFTAKLLQNAPLQLKGSGKISLTAVANIKVGDKLFDAEMTIFKAF